jgi:Transcriptional regulator
MSDKRLLVFYTVAKVLSFTKAAKKLHMTQPAVTFQVRQLEEKFDLKLFDRKQNRIYLTEAGQKAFYYADKIFNLNNEMQHELKILSDEQNTSINLGGSTTVAQYLLPLLLKGFLKETPF